jgi:hypothetical protein
MRPEIGYRKRAGGDGSVYVRVACRLNLDGAGSLRHGTGQNLEGAFPDGPSVPPQPLHGAITRVLGLPKRKNENKY